MSLADQIGPGFAGPLRWLRADDLNELREELAGLRERVDTLAELVRRADEHTEGCP